MKEFIVNSYDKKKRFDLFKEDWKNQFLSVAKMLDFEVKQITDNWFLVENEIKKTSVIDTHGEALSSKSSYLEDHRLTEEEKTLMGDMFDSIDERYMWKLATGVLVEKQMKVLAVNCTYEHQCHFLILDTNDLIWKEYFTDRELLEIKDIGDKHSEGFITIV